MLDWDIEIEASAGLPRDFAYQRFGEPGVYSFWLKAGVQAPKLRKLMARTGLDIRCVDGSSAIYVGKADQCMADRIRSHLKGRGTFPASLAAMIDDQVETSLEWNRCGSPEIWKGRAAISKWMGENLILRTLPTPIGAARTLEKKLLADWRPVLAMNRSNDDPIVVDLRNMKAASIISREPVEEGPIEFLDIEDPKLISERIPADALKRATWRPAIDRLSSIYAIWARCGREELEAGGAIVGPDSVWRAPDGSWLIFAGETRRDPIQAAHLALFETGSPFRRVLGAALRGFLGLEQRARPNGKTWWGATGEAALSAWIRECLTVSAYDRTMGDLSFMKIERERRPALLVTRDSTDARSGRLKRMMSPPV